MIIKVLAAPGSIIPVVDQHELWEQLKADQDSDPAFGLQHVALPVEAFQFLAERLKCLDLLPLANLVEGKVQIV